MGNKTERDTRPCCGADKLAPHFDNCEHAVTIATPRNVCKHCGGVEFYAQYVERAVARLNADGDVLDDGYNVDSFELNYETATCAECDKPHEWKKD